MPKIDLQRHAKPREGAIGYHWFENQKIGLKRTLFHRVTLPFEPFDTGLDYVEQPEKPELFIDWIELDLMEPGLLAGIELASVFHKGMEASIYIGGAHNWCEIETLYFKEVALNLFEIDAKTQIDFSSERVADNESFTFCG